MCGIAGFAGLRMTRQEAAHSVRTMCDAIVHRGPDSDGYFVADEVALGMRRLSIIDVQGGDQPIENEDGSVTVVFNGEIYNHSELRRQLLAAGHRFETHSDTEVLVHLYEERGPDMVEALHGMFAFAIWDAPRKRLLIARDHTGIKPLSYAEQGDGIVFFSELRSLLAIRDDIPSVSAAAVMQYLAFGYVPDPNSIFEDVRKLPPGHWLLWDRESGVRVRQYWRPPAADPSMVDEASLVAELGSRIDKAVASHLESEVPLGAFLSGGLDSSTVVALMSRHSRRAVRTFSIGFDEAEFDESKTAKAVARELGTEHTALIVRPEVDDMFESIAAVFDEPFGDSSAIPTLLVAQLARQSVTVALSGDGGDELFGGYTRYRETLGQTELPPSVRSVLQTVARWMPQSALGRNRIMDLGRTRWGRYASHVAEPLRIDEGGVARQGLPLARCSIAEQLADCLSDEVADDFAASMMRVDTKTYLPGDILTKVDRTSMAVSLEARVPLLDLELVNFAQRIPGHLRVNAKQTKILFRRAIAQFIPEFVLNGPKKGFSVPLGAWFRGPLKHRVEALRRRSSGRLAEYVDDAALRRVVGEHLWGRRDHSGMLWRLTMLDHWLQALEHGRLKKPPSISALGAS